MDTLDRLTFAAGGRDRTIELCRGDLTALRPDEAVDILIVSAFPGDYTPTPRSLIGALAAKGISVWRLSRSKAADLRAHFSCWLSRDVSDTPRAAGIQFRRILCFEPLSRGNPPHVVGEIFQAIGAILAEGSATVSVAMPLVATGDQRVPVEAMLDPLLDAAAHWMANGLPVHLLKIAVHDADAAAQAREAFGRLQTKYGDVATPDRPDARFDVFISYSHDDAPAARLIAEVLPSQRPDLRLFIDRLNLKPGAAWQQEIFEALDACNTVVALYSPSYLKSKVCKEEFNIALYRERECDRQILFPIYLRSTSLPTYMKLRQYVDCREDDRDRVRAACTTLLGMH